MNQAPTNSTRHDQPVPDTTLCRSRRGVLREAARARAAPTGSPRRRRGRAGRSATGRRSAAFSAFARAWRRGYEPAMTTRTCQLYLISPLDVGGDFPARLEEALSAAPVAAFQDRTSGG